MTPTDTPNGEKFEKAYLEACQLADNFHANKAYYLATSYQESQARVDFIDKFFTLLGWDVAHNEQINPYAQEVKVELKVKTGAANRRADYAFSLNSNAYRTIFFVEAKKPGVDIATVDNYFQAIRYSWNTQLPLVVLTDFASFHIIDSRDVPDPETALSRQHKVFSYQDYKDKEKFALIYWLFSREAVGDNSLGKYTQTLPDSVTTVATFQLGLFGGGYISVDELFLKQLNDYRLILARSYKRDNQELTSEQLTEIVQRTLDRIVFLRFLEDKLIEPERIVQKIASHKHPWAEFISQTRRLDSIYNGVVFKPHSLLDKPGFVKNATDFVGILKKISDPHSPYDFDRIPVEILGRIYEEFLGSVVTATAKGVVVEEKPDVRQAGGVYYTPDYIVQYMAEQALAPLIAKKTAAELCKIRVIDTACGSGSFLIGAFDVLQRALGKIYFDNKEMAKPGDWIEKNGQPRLSLKIKRELLVQCLYGVDIDPQAVEVAQLSLYLKLMEDETTDSARTGQLEIAEALLPTLNRNIVVGNSLTAPLDSDAKDLFIDEAGTDYGSLNIRAAFPHVMGKEKALTL